MKTNKEKTNKPGVEVDSIEKYQIVRSEALGLSVLFGAVSNTLRDMMNNAHGLLAKEPYAIVLPPVLFDGKRSLGEFEFLLYYNAFFLGNIFKSNGNKVRVVGTPMQLAALRELLDLTIYGPNWDSPECQTLVKNGVVDPKREAFFRQMQDYYAVKDKRGAKLPIEAYIEMIAFNAEGKAEVRVLDNAGKTRGTLGIQEKCLDGLRVTAYEITEWRFGSPDDNRRQIGTLEVDYRMPAPRRYAIPAGAREEIKSASGGFSRTWMGTNSGFDPLGDNTSEIIWLEGTGIWVDPSHEALAYMDELGLGERDVPFILLTHIHQDHDGGVLERILLGKRIQIIASEVVYRSFLSKAALILKFLGRSLKPEELAEWIPLNPGKKWDLKLPSGRIAEIESWWNLHPIPTNGFSVKYEGFKYAHSGDTQWGLDLIDKLVEQDVITPIEGRAQKFRLWDKSGRAKADFIDHEAGGGMIHTSLEDLARLPYSSRDRMAVYHVGDASVKASHGLHKAKSFETRVFVPSDEYRREKNFMSVLASNALIQGKTADWLEVFKKLATHQRYAAGEDLILEGQAVKIRGNVIHGMGSLTMEGATLQEPLMYFICSGKVGIYKNGRKVATLGPGQQFGEWALVTGEPRSATVSVEEAMDAYLLTASNFHILFGDPVTQQNIKWVRQNLDVLSEWTRKAACRTFQDLSDFALTVLAGSAESRAVKKGAVLIREGEEGREFFILKSGTVDIVKNIEADETLVATLGPGAPFGEIALLTGDKRTATVRASEDSEVLVLKRDAFERMLSYYPFIRVSLSQELEERLQDLTRLYFQKGPVSQWLGSHLEPRILLSQWADRLGWESVYHYLDALNRALNDFIEQGGSIGKLQVAAGIKSPDQAVRVVLCGAGRAMNFSNLPDYVMQTAILIEPNSLVLESAREIARLLSPAGVIFLVTRSAALQTLFVDAGFDIATLVPGLYDLRKAIT